MNLSRRSFVGLAGMTAITALLGGSLMGCSSGSGSGASSAASADLGFDLADWDSVVKAADGQKVAWYGWGGEEPRNKWIDTVIAPALKEKYNITLERVPMDAPSFVSKLSGEMQAGTNPGSIDFLWINGENFYTVKKNGYLYGPFAESLPNFKSYVDATDPEMQYDFGEPIEGYEAPYGKAQMTLWADSAVVGTDFPKDPDAFLAFCEAHAGKVTYPEPGDFTGTAFISCLIAGVIGKDEWSKLASMEADKEAVRALIQPGLEYLRKLNPYLWQKGATFPADSGIVANMFADGELVLNMNYGFPTADIKDGKLPATVRSFVLDTGTVGNANFMAIAQNAPSKAGALVAINEIMSPEIQLSQYTDLSTMTVLDLDKLPAEDRAKFDAVPVAESEVPLDELLGHRLVEANGACIPLIEEIWHEEVVGK